ncbi:four-jointed box protein 1-like [Ciona intestinalis]
MQKTIRSSLCLLFILISILSLFRWGISLNRDIVKIHQLNNDTVFVRISNEYCGRLKNRALETREGDIYCARYRENIEFIQGEYYSAVLSSILGITNTPDVYIEQVKPDDELWKRVWKNLEAAGWRPLAVVSITLFIPDLQTVEFPRYLKDCFDCKMDKEYIKSSPEESDFLTQWSDMILLDYVTGDVDRVIGHVHNLKWDDRSFDRPVHNLMKNQEGSLYFFDNESAFGHSYRLLARYQTLHDVTLKRVCVFSRRTKTKLTELAEKSFDVLKENFRGTDDLVPPLPEKDILTLKMRLLEADTHVRLGCS